VRRWRPLGVGERVLVRRPDDTGLAVVAAAITDPAVLARGSSTPANETREVIRVTSGTTIPVGIYWKPGVWDLARSAYVADLDTNADSPGSFVGWLAQALELHARRSPQQRAELAAAGEKHPALVSVTRKSFNKKLDLPASTIEALEVALAADRQELGRMLARSAFAQEAVIAAAEEARRRLGRDLPPPPQKLSNRPPRRRPAR
jgi:signal transduction histidine kinase